MSDASQQAPPQAGPGATTPPDAAPRARVSYADALRNDAATTRPAPGHSTAQRAGCISFLLKGTCARPQCKLVHSSVPCTCTDTACIKFHWHATPTKGKKTAATSASGSSLAAGATATATATAPRLTAATWQLIQSAECAFSHRVCPYCSASFPLQLPAAAAAAPQLERSSVMFFSAVAQGTPDVELPAIGTLAHSTHAASGGELPYDAHVETCRAAMYGKTLSMTADRCGIALDATLVFLAEVQKQFLEEKTLLERRLAASDDMVKLRLLERTTATSPLTAVIGKEISRRRTRSVVTAAAASSTASVRSAPRAAIKNVKQAAPKATAVMREKPAAKRRGNKNGVASPADAAEAAAAPPTRPKPTETARSEASPADSAAAVPEPEPLRKGTVKQMLQPNEATAAASAPTEVPPEEASLPPQLSTTATACAELICKDAAATLPSPQPATLPTAEAPLELGSATALDASRRREFPVDEKSARKKRMGVKQMPLSHNKTSDASRAAAVRASHTKEQLASHRTLDDQQDRGPATTSAPPFSRGRGGDDLTVDGCVEGHPGPTPNLAAFATTLFAPAAAVTQRRVLLDDDDDAAAAPSPPATLPPPVLTVDDAEMLIATATPTTAAAHPPSVPLPSFTAFTQGEACTCSKPPGRGRHKECCPKSATHHQRKWLQGRLAEVPAGADLSAAIDRLAAEVHMQVSVALKADLIAEVRQRFRPASRSAPVLTAAAIPASHAAPAAPTPGPPLFTPSGTLSTGPPESAAVSMLGRLARTQVPMIERLPAPAARTVGHALATLCFAAAEKNDVTHWTALLTFAKLVLRRTPRSQARHVTKTIDDRLRRLALGHHFALLLEAEDDAKTFASRERPSKTSFPVDVEDAKGPFSIAAVAATDATADAVDPAILRRCERLVKNQQLSKAAAALSAARVADVNDASVADMRQKHPCGPSDVPCPVLPRLPPTPSISGKSTLKVLQQFPLGTAAGPLGLAAQHLLDCCCVVGSTLPDALAAVCTTLLSKEVPQEVRPFLFGARLIALVKKDGGLRPIACGEILRRLAGKTLCSLHKTRLREHLLERSQIGVGVRAGADAMVFAARDAVAQISDDYAAVKLDFRNAFNEIHRSAVLEAIAAAVPEALQYAASAYSSPSWLFFGDRQLASSQGVQQGDPLGPALFSAALAKLWDSVPADAKAALDVSAFYLDDGFLAGPPAALEVVVKHFAEVGPSIGVHLNAAKSEVIGTDIAAASFPGFRHTPADAWELLGAPCAGTYTERWMERLEEKAKRRVELIARLHSPHAALALLQKCGASPITMFAARMVGPHGLFSRLDMAMHEAASRVALGEEQLLPVDAWARAQLPVRLGGLGLRACARHCAIAHVAAFAAALPVVPHLRRSLLQSALSFDDATSSAAAAAAHPTAAAAPPSADAAAPPPATARPLALAPPRSLTVCPTHSDVALVPTVPHQLAHLATHGALDTQTLGEADKQAAKHRGAQHALSAIVERWHGDAVRHALSDDVARATLSSATAPHAGAWLSGVPGKPLDDAWLQPEEFRLATRLRLGLAVAPHDYTCGLCRKAVVGDPLGHHALTCSSGGMRKYLHDALVRQVHHVASQALLAPTIECTLPLPQDEGATRADIVMPAPDGSGAIWVVDLAVTHIRRTDDAGHARAAADTPGGAATLYEKVKQERYKLPLAELNARAAAPTLGVALAAAAAQPQRTLAASTATSLTAAQSATTHASLAVAASRAGDSAAAAAANTAAQAAIGAASAAASAAEMAADDALAAVSPTPPQQQKYVLVPLVVDTHGAWSENARAALARIGRHWGTRICSRLATAMFFHRLSVVRARHVARILLDSASADSAPSLRSDGAALLPPPCPATASATAGTTATRAAAFAAVRGVGTRARH